MRIITDVFSYAGEHIPRWNTISISGYHMREAGATAAQEIAFTLANGIAYVQAALDAGLAVDDVAPRLSFFFACHMNFFEEVAKFRAARRMWARVMSERLSKDPRSAILRFHSQTGGATLTAQQPQNNIVRTALEALSAVLGGTQSLHTNSFDEALALPSEHAAKIALRTQQIIADESGVADTADPLGGSYFVESLTNQLRRARCSTWTRSTGWAARWPRSRPASIRTRSTRPPFASSGIESGDRVVVGVNRFEEADEQPPQLLRISDEEVAGQVESGRLRAERDGSEVRRRLADLARTAQGTGDLLPDEGGAASRATLGEVSDVLRETFGEYHPTH